MHIPSYRSSSCFINQRGVKHQKFQTYLFSTLKAKVLWFDDVTCRYVIVGSASVDDGNFIDHFDMYRNNESVTPNPRSPLEHYTLHIVDIEMGRLTDSRTFMYDKIFLSHNQGLYLYRHTLAVLSVQHQTIHIFQVSCCYVYFVNVIIIIICCFLL